MFQQTDSGAPAPATEVEPAFRVRFKENTPNIDKAAALGETIGLLAADEFQRNGGSDGGLFPGEALAAALSPYFLAVASSAFTAAANHLSPGELEPEASDTDRQLAAVGLGETLQRMLAFAAAREFVDKAARHAASGSAEPPPRADWHLAAYTALVAKFGREILEALDPESDAGRPVAAALQAEAAAKQEASRAYGDAQAHLDHAIAEGRAKAAGVEVTEVIERDAQGEIVRLVKRPARPEDFLAKSEAGK